MTVARVAVGEARIVRERLELEHVAAARVQNFSVMHMTKIQPSAVGNVCTGASEKWLLRSSRDAASPLFKYHVPA